MDKSYFKTGLEYLSKGNFFFAIEYFQAEIEQNPLNEKAYIQLSKVFCSIGKTNEALKTLYSLLSIDPNNQNALKKIEECRCLSEIHREELRSSFEESPMKCKNQIVSLHFFYYVGKTDLEVTFSIVYHNYSNEILI